MISKYSPNYDIDIKLPDMKPLIDKMSVLPEKVQKRVARSATRKAMAVVRDAAIGNAMRFDRERTKEQVFKNVVVQEATRSSKRVGGVYMRVGVRGGAKQYANTRENVRKRRVGASYKTLGDSGNPGGDTWYWRFLEFGTARTEAKPFLRRAFKDKLTTVQQIVEKELEKGISKLVNSK